MTGWIDDLDHALSSAGSAVLVTVAAERGSLPREAGAKMVVTADQILGTIGGGNLEYQAIARARSLLRGKRLAPSLQQVALGPSLGQCCGGSVQLLYEPIERERADWLSALRSALAEGQAAILVSRTAGAAGKLVVTARPSPGTIHDDALWSRAESEAVAMLDQGNVGPTVQLARARDLLFERLAPDVRLLFLFGAGHVGRALVRQLETLPFDVRWIDDRPLAYPADLAPNVKPVCTRDWLAVIETAPPGADYVVMTYSHDLDLAICTRILEHDRFRYLGLIGSKTKRRRFERRLTELGIDQARLARLICPIGLPGIEGKTPAIIALAVAAQLMSQDSGVAPGLTKKAASAGPDLGTFQGRTSR